jgi:3-dehydroquinate dehydratase-1
VTIQIAPGGLPLVVGTLSSSKWELLRNPSEVPCDLVEVRLDLIGWAGDWLERCRAVEASGLPVLLTVRRHTEGGQWRGPDQGRFELYQQALPHVSAVDVELRSDIARPVVQQARRLGKVAIVSFHDFERTPPADELRAVLVEAQEYATVAKITTMARGESDLGTLRGLLAGQWKVPVCVMGMGPLGAKSRASLAALGSCLTYGYLDEPAAPGQLSAAELIRELRAVVPGYAQHRTSLEQTRTALNAGSLSQP